MYLFIYLLITMLTKKSLGGGGGISSDWNVWLFDCLFGEDKAIEGSLKLRKRLHMGGGKKNIINDRVFR